MDIFSHGLWSGAAAKAINTSQASGVGGHRLNAWLAAFWGVFPDLFAFTIPFVWMAWHVWILRNEDFSVRKATDGNATRAMVKYAIII